MRVCINCGKDENSVPFYNFTSKRSHRCKRCYKKTYNHSAPKPTSKGMTREDIPKKVLNDVTLAVCYAYGISVDDVQNKNRKPENVEPRQMIWKILDEYPYNHGRSAIARCFFLNNTNKSADHSTIYYGVGRISNLIDTEEHTMLKYKIAKQYLNNQTI